MSSKLDIEAARDAFKITEDCQERYAWIIEASEAGNQVLDELVVARTLVEIGSCSICGTISLSPPYCSHKQPCRPVYAKLEQANARISELEQELQQKSSPQFRGVPDHWPPSYNADNDPCDMIDGPCACGGWHSLDEEWVKINMERYGEKK